MQDTRSFGGRVWALLATVAFLFALFVSPLTVRAGTTGVLEGTITDTSTGKPIADAAVKAVSPSGTFSSVTDAHGFYAIMNMLPDTYTVQIAAKGYADTSVPGVFVQQDDIVRFDRKLASVGLREIASVKSRSAGNLVTPYNGSDVYNVSGAQLNAATGGTDTHETEYQYIDTVPGVVGNGGYGVGQPSIRGGFSDVDTGFELDGVPISDRQTGFFGTNLTDIGVGNVEVVTGGLLASQSANGTGIINQVSKVGTYPGYISIATGMTSAQFNHYLRIQVSGATPNGKFSWYGAFDGANSQNSYWVGNQILNGNNYPLIGVPSTNGIGYPEGISSGNAGAIYTRDVLVNFHWRPTSKDDIQVLNLNTYFNDQANWGINNGPNYPGLGVAACPGATAGVAGSASSGAGGTAPDGQTCPIGLYSYDLPSGEGNFLGHTSDVAKIQWNHTINSTSSFEVHAAEFFNQYTFNQPYSDPNWAEEDGAWAGTGCPSYPVPNGTPVGSFGPYFWDQCLYNLGDYYQNRTEHNYFYVGDYTWTPSENLTVQAGVQQEYDNQFQEVNYLNMFNGSAAVEAAVGGLCYGNANTYPCINQLSDNPAHTPAAWAQASWNIGKFTLQPGVRWSRDFYGVPAYAGGTVSAGYILPTLAGTYRINYNNVIRFSYSDTATFTGSTYVYELNNPTFDPGLNGPTAYEPALNHIVDVGFEHQFNPETSLRFTAYTRATNNYPDFYTPFNGFIPGTNEWEPATPVMVNNLMIRQFGGELGINHVDPKPTGASWWLSGSYCNCWTQIGGYNGSHGSYFNLPLTSYFTSQGIMLRSESTPLFAATLTADLHTHGWHLIPYLYWTFDNFYNVGGCLPLNAAGTGYETPNQNIVPQGCGQNTLANGSTVNPVLSPEGIGMGYWYANLSLYKDLGAPGRVWTVGLSVQNLFNMQHGTVPSCYANYVAGSTAPYNTGTCWPYGSQSGTIGAPNGWDYQNFVNGTPRSIEVFARARIGRGNP
jgi:Carboxypeptidase regulatory-like domain